MPRRMMDYRMMDMRNPYGAEGGYVSSSRRGRRGGRRDRAMSRGMDYAYDRRDYRGSDYEYDSRQNDRAYSREDMARGRRDYESMGESDMAYDNMDMRRRRNSRGQYMSDRGYENEMDGHYPMSQGSTYYPIEAMGRFTGYWGEPEGDYARGGRYDMRGRDYGYDYAGDYGETLSREELEHWKKKLMKEIDEKDKQFFSKESIMNKAKQMGLKFDKYNEEELEVATLMVYTDYCKTLGTSNMDLYLRLAKDWLEDDDVAVKGGEKLAVYYDCIVSDEE